MRRLRLITIIMLSLISISFSLNGCSPSTAPLPAPTPIAPVPPAITPVPPVTTPVPPPQNQTTPPITTPAIPTPVPGPNEFWMVNDQYVPAKLTVTVGTTVTWTNKQPEFHTVTSYDGLFNSGPLSFGQIFSYTFNQTGTFNYYCEPHPDMIGTVIVK